MGKVRDIVYLTDSQLQSGHYDDNDSLYLVETTGANISKQIGSILNLSTGASNAKTATLSAPVTDFDYIIIRVRTHTTTVPDTFVTFTIPTGMWTLYQSSTANEQFTFKTASTYYVRCYFGTNTSITFAAAGTSVASIYIYGVEL